MESVREAATTGQSTAWADYDRRPEDDASSSDAESSYLVDLKNWGVTFADLAANFGKGP